MLINFDGMQSADGIMNFYIPPNIDWDRAVRLFNASFYATYGCPASCPADQCEYCICTTLGGPFTLQRMEKFAELAGKRGYLITREGFEKFSSPNLHPVSRIAKMEV